MKRFFVACLLVFLQPPAPGALDSVPPAPVRRLFASACGNFALEVTVSYRSGAAARARGRLFTFDRSGNEEEIWTKQLNFIPSRILISDRGFVVVLNDWYWHGYAHSVVLLSRDGVMLKDYSLEGLLGTEEIGEHVVHTVSNRYWDTDAVYRFTRDRFIVDLQWGRTLIFDLKTGELVEPDSTNP